MLMESDGKIRIQGGSMSYWVVCQRRKRMDLRTRGGGRVNWDEVREWHGHRYTTKCKIDS